MILPELSDPSGPLADVDHEPALHVIIVHDDTPAYRRALRLLVRVLGPDAGEPTVQPLPWRFSELSHRDWRERAWKDAERADVFIVATEPGAEVPDDMIDWLEMSFERRRQRSTAVIWLESAAARRHEGQARHRMRIRQSAEAAGLSFIERCEPAESAAR